MRPEPDPPPGSLGDGWFVAGLIVVGFAAAGAVVALIVMRATGTVWDMIDLAVYRWGGSLVVDGRDLYASEWLGHDIANYHGGPLQFTYPPFAALLFAIVSFVPLGTAQVILLIADGICLYVVARTSFLSLGYARNRGLIGACLLVATLSLLLEPVAQTVHLGQVNLILLAVILPDLLRSDGSRWKGIPLGIACGIKLTPLVFVAFLLLTRRWRPAARALLTMLATIVIALAVLPADSKRYWTGGVFTDAARVGGVDYAGNQSITGAFTRFGIPSSLSLATAIVFGCLALWAAAMLSRRGPELAAVLLVALAGLLVSPISWSHHWVWLVPASVLLIDAARRRVHSLVAVLVLAAVLALGLVVTGTVPGLIWRVPHGGGAERDWSMLEMLAGNAYVIAGTAAVVATLAWLRVAGRPGRPDRSVLGG